MKARAALLLLVTIAFGAAPFLTPPFRGYDPALFPVQIARPSAFSIWGLIYMWLAVHAVTFLWKRREDADWLAVAGQMILSLGVGSLWLYIAPTVPVVAGVAIIVMAVTALTAFLRADTFADRWTLAAPIAIYAGWLSAASAVSTGVILAGYGVLSDTDDRRDPDACHLGPAQEAPHAGLWPDRDLGAGGDRRGECRPQPDRCHPRRPRHRVDGTGPALHPHGLRVTAGPFVSAQIPKGSGKPPGRIVRNPRPLSPDGGEGRGEGAQSFRPSICLRSREGVWNLRSLNGFLSDWLRNMIRIGTPGISKWSRNPLTR